VAYGLRSRYLKKFDISDAQVNPSIHIWWL
jgi:hypothetical protein